MTDRLKRSGIAIVSSLVFAVGAPSSAVAQDGLEQPFAQTAPREAEPAAGPDGTLDDERTASSGLAWRIAGWSLVVGGVGLGVTATVLDLQYREDRKEGLDEIAREHDCRYNPDNDAFIGSECQASAVRDDPTYQDFVDEMRSRNTRNQLLLGGAAAMVLGGAVVLALQYAADAEYALFPTIGVSQDGAWASLRAEF